MKKFFNFVFESDQKFNIVNRKLLEGIQNDDLQKVKEAVDEGSDIDQHEGYPMVCASSMGRLSIVKYFVEKNTKFKDKGLYYSSAYGKTDVSEFLLKCNADPNYMAGATLIWSLEKNQIDSVRLLLQHKAKIDNLYKNPLGIAIDNGNFQMVKLLVDYGSDITREQIEKSRRTNNTIYEYLSGIMSDVHKSRTSNVSKPQKKDFFNFQLFEETINDNFGIRRIKSKKVKLDNKKCIITFIISTYNPDYDISDSYNIIKNDIKPYINKFCNGYSLSYALDIIDETEIEIIFTFNRIDGFNDKPKNDINKHTLYKLSQGGNYIQIKPFKIEEKLEELYDFRCSYFNYSNQQKNVVFMYDNLKYDWETISKVRKFLYDNLIYLIKIELNIEEPYLVLNFGIIDTLSVITI